MTDDKHKEIWEQIEKQRATYEAVIEKADETIRAAQALKKDAREGLDALPVAKVRRPRKASFAGAPHEMHAEEGE